MGLFRILYNLKKVNKNQWKNIDELKKIQEKKLRSIIDYAYNNVLFYHDLFKQAKILPSEIKKVEDLNKVPLVTKEDLRENFPHNIISQKVDYTKCKIWETSGSAGLTTKTAYDAKADDFAKAIILRSYLGNGLKYFDRWCVVGPDEYKIEKPKGYFVGRKIGFISPFYISVFDSIEKKIQLLRKFNPRVLDCLSTDIFLIAKYIKENDIDDINPEIVTSNGEYLDGSMRKYINDVFGVELSDLYGCYELRRTAWECSCHEGYHIDVDSLVMQFIKDGEDVTPGEEGRIVFTGLYNYAMPIIRYDIEDVGVPSDEFCSCGRGLPIMRILKGKSIDLLVATDGRLVSPYTVKIILAHIPGIKLLKLIQYSKEKIKVLIVKDTFYRDEYNMRVEKAFKDLLGEDVFVEIEFVDEIKRGGRKYKVIESRIPKSDMF